MTRSVRPFPELAKVINTELDRLFPKDIQVLAEPGRFLAAVCGTSVSSVIGKVVREGKTSYYINDGGLSHLLGRHLRSLQVPGHGLQEGAHEPQLGLWSDLRCARRRLDGREPARSEAR